jgi:acyl carrier protein
MNALDERITAVFREFFGDDHLEVTDATTFSDVQGWSSLAHVNLVSALESEFNTRFSVQDLVKMTSVGAIRRAVAARVERQAGASTAT